MTRYRADYACEEPEHRSDKLLVVMAEGTQGFGDRAKPIGLLDAAVMKGQA